MTTVQGDGDGDGDGVVVGLGSFEICTSGKWILAGEHAVLRGSPSLVFPLKGRGMRFQWEPGAQDLLVQFQGECGKEIELLFWGVLEKALSKKQIDRSKILGRLRIESSLPVGGGLGASAALCVGLTKWLMKLGYVSESEILDFARDLENLFHGESSGVDVAVSAYNCPLKFYRGKTPTQFVPKWKPNLYLSYSGERGVTSECVQKVKSLFETNPVRAKALDDQMAQAVALAERALQEPQGKGLELLIQSLKLGQECFQEWGLVDKAALGSHVQRLVRAGALAVKVTGSGQGGYVLSLWQDEPSVDIQSELTSCF